jgi:hypothetical protein
MGCVWRVETFLHLTLALSPQAEREYVVGDFSMEMMAGGAHSSPRLRRVNCPPYRSVDAGDGGSGGARSGARASKVSWVLGGGVLASPCRLCQAVLRSSSYEGHAAAARWGHLALPRQVAARWGHVDFVYLRLRSGCPTLAPGGISRICRRRCGRRRFARGRRRSLCRGFRGGRCWRGGGWRVFGG